MTKSNRVKVESLKILLEKSSQRIRELHQKLEEVSAERDFYETEALALQEELTHLRRGSRREDVCGRDEVTDADVLDGLPQICGEWAPSTTIEYASGFIWSLSRTPDKTLQKTVARAVDTIAQNGEKYSGLRTKLAPPEVQSRFPGQRPLISRVNRDQRLIWSHENDIITVLEFGHHTEYYSKER